MRRRLVVVSVLVMAISLSACSKNEWGGIFWWGSELTLDDIYGKTSLTVNDLKTIDELLFPKWYSYQTYQLSDWSISDAGDYKYENDVDHSLLIPIHDWMVSREIVSSNAEKNMIYTKVNVTLSDDKIVPVLYINDIDTLKYVFATVYTDKETIMYTFNY